MQVDAGIQIPGMAAQSQVQGNDIPQGGMTWNPQMQSDMLGNNIPPINQGGQNPQPAMTGNQNPQHIMTANQGTQAVPQNQDGQSQSMPQGTANPQSSASAQSNPMMNQFYQQAQEKGATIGQNPVGASQMQNSFGNQNQQTGQMPQMQGNTQSSSQYSPAASLDESLPVEELVQRMTYEQAAQVVITGNGKFGGKTMGQVAVESPKNLEWFAQSYSGKNHLIPAAARVLLNAAMPMAG